MESSLYDPKQGYYYRRSPRQDFYTAPELHRAFADILSSEICSYLQRADSALKDKNCPLFVVEMGSGDGTLARQILRALKASHPEWLSRIRYVLVERVGTLLLDSMLNIQDGASRTLGYTQLEDLPCFKGVLFSNELLDAMPVHLLEKRGGKIQEVYVDPGENQQGKAYLGEFSRAELRSEAAAWAPRLEEGQRHAVNLDARAWLKRVAALLRAGAVITIDYGGELDSSPNAPRAFYRHVPSEQILDRSGVQDLTASVDFSALMAEGEALGLKTAHFSSLGRFLIDRGILGLLPAGDSAEEFKERNQIKTIFHPQGMGETFKVLIQEKLA